MTDEQMINAPQPPKQPKSLVTNPKEGWFNVTEESLKKGGLVPTLNYKAIEHERTRTDQFSTWLHEHPDQVFNDARFISFWGPNRLETDTSDPRYRETIQYDVAIFPGGAQFVFCDAGSYVQQIQEPETVSDLIEEAINALQEQAQNK